MLPDTDLKKYSRGTNGGPDKVLRLQLGDEFTLLSQAALEECLHNCGLPVFMDHGRLLIIGEEKDLEFEIGIA